MTINDQIRDEKLQYDINREAAKISALSSGKIHKYEYLTGEDILPSNQQQIIEQAKFTYSPLGKAFEKQIKTIEDQGKKQVDALNTLKSNNQLTIEDVIPKNALINDEAKKELDKIKEIEKNLDRNKLIYETNAYTYSYIYSYIYIVIHIVIYIYFYNLFEGREKTLDAFESKIFLIKSKGAGILDLDHSRLKVLTPKQMLQRLPIALAQVKASNNSESLLNEIRQIVYSLYQSKQITKKVYNNIIKSINI